MLDNIILREIGALTRTIHAILEIKFKGLNLQKGQSIFLTRICENPGINMKELSQMLMMDKTTTSKVVLKLAAEKLVRKTRDTHDKRAFQLFPTPKAEQAYGILIAEENRLIRQCYQGFEKKQQAIVLELIQNMRRNIDDDWLTLKSYKPAGTDTMKIRPALTPADIRAVRHLFLEYEDAIDIDLDFQDFETELAGLPGAYAPPGGAILMGQYKSAVAGCVALRKLAHGTCEMKRLYVRPEARQYGLGKKLVREIILLAGNLGYARMRLDAMDTFTDAIALYESFGFKQIPPYYDNPLPGALYWELEIQTG